MINFLPKTIMNCLNGFIENLCEIRLRRNYPIKVKIGLKSYYISSSGITLFKDNAVFCDEKIITEIINNATKYSIYAFNDSIKKGFITTSDGVRIGLAGECVYLNGEVQTIKNLSSLNIRIPHKIQGCSDGVYKYIVDSSEVLNTLIISPPMQGKTTILKDLAEKLSNRNSESIMIIDERGEFSKVEGENIDRIAYGDKLFAFQYGLRSLSPDLVIADELQNENDWKFVKNAANCGVKIIASCHAADIDQVINKEFFNKEIFDRYIILRTNHKIGQLYKIYDKEFNLI